MAVRSFHFCRRYSLLDLVIRCKDRDLTRIDLDAQDTVVAGLQAALIVTACERLREI